MYESWLHWCNTWIEDFFKEIESKDYSIVLASKYRELYLKIHQYKFTLVKHIQLFDFQTWEFVFTNLARLVGHLYLSSLSPMKKKTSSPCCQLQWPLARTLELYQLRVKPYLVLLSSTTILVQLLVVGLKLLINFNFNWLMKPSSKQWSPWIFLQGRKFLTKNYPPWSTSSLGANPPLHSQEVVHMIPHMS